MKSLAAFEQGVEGALVHGLFGVPLHGQHEAGRRQLDRLGHTVAGAGGDHQAAAQVAARPGGASSSTVVPAPNTDAAVVPGAVPTSTSSKCMGWRRWSTFPTTSGRCWCSVPPKKTFSTWQPRQMASTGRSASSAAARRARSLASRFGSTPPTSGSGSSP